MRILCVHGFGSSPNVQSLVFDHMCPSADPAFCCLGNESTNWYIGTIRSSATPKSLREPSSKITADNLYL